MKNQTASLLWLAGTCLIGALLVQVFLARGELLKATADLGSLRSDIAQAQRNLDRINNRTARLDDLLRAKRTDAAANVTLTPEEQVIESLRGKLAEIAARHAGETRPAPLTSIHGNNYAAELLDDPAYAKLYRAWYRLILEKDWNDFFASGLAPPETMARLAELLMERQLGVMDLIAATGASRYGPTNLPTKEQRDANNRSSQALYAQYAADIRSLLGDDLFAKFERHEKTTILRRDLATIIDRLSYSDSPVTRQQSAQLEEIIASPTLASSSGTLIRSGSEVDSEFNTKARAVLTPPQLELLKQLRTETGARQAAAGH